MRQGTTPSIFLSIDGYDLTDKSVFVTIGEKNNWSLNPVQITKTNDDLAITFDGSASTIVFNLSQEETLSFPKGVVELQVRFIDKDGNAEATDIVKMDVGRILFREKIAFEKRDEENGQDD